MLPEAPVPQNSASAPTTSTSTSSNASSSQSETTTSAALPPADTPATAPADAKQQQHAEAERELKVQEKQRLLGIMPQFQVVMGGQAVPLTGKQKWDLALHTTFDPFYIGWALVIGGGYGELTDSNSGFGWGPPGYFKRVGANYADNVNGALVGNALLPQLLHQDPRYFRKGSGSVGSRFLSAALSTIICKGDNGKSQANVSNVLGNFISGAISNAYYPADQRGVSQTLETGASVTLFGALGGQILEFGPDISRLVLRKKQSAPAILPVTPTVAPTAAPSAPATGATGTLPK